MQSVQAYRNVHQRFRPSFHLSCLAMRTVEIIDNMPIRFLWVTLVKRDFAQEALCIDVQRWRDYHGQFNECTS
jgi:hypothetical protein